MPIFVTGMLSNRKNGYSLFELVITLALLSVVLALALPSFSLISLDSTRADAQKTASVLRHINDIALTRKETVPFSVDFGNKIISWKTSDGTEKKVVPSLKSLYTPHLGSVSSGKVDFDVTSLGALEEMEITFSREDKGWTVIYSLNNLVRVREISNCGFRNSDCGIEK
ncbi:MAG: prepilin-type N-terminal cleavage/methylation domain-containing protein [Pseudomonadota bacterium]